MDQNEKDAEVEIVKSHVNQLMDHFESVHIFATRHDGVGDGTVNINYGLGNWFARFGQVYEWIVKHNERTRKHVQESD